MSSIGQTNNSGQIVPEAENNQQKEVNTKSKTKLFLNLQNLKPAILFLL